MTTVVVGGGASGVLVARELMRCTGDRVVLVDPAPAPGAGLAYGTAQPWHLLNSPAGAMGADPDAPDGFVDWCRAAGRPADPAALLPRAWYGDYLRHELLRTAAAHPGRLRHRRARATHVDPLARGARVRLDDGTAVAARRVVLAIGNPPPAPAWDTTGVRDSAAYVADPWRPGALRRAAVGRGPVLVVGSGLTAVDVVQTLTALGHRGPITLLSRHGLLPLPHRPAGADGAPVPSPEPVGSLAALLRAVRARADAAADWRDVADGLRPAVDRLWFALPLEEQRRFLRHVARHWEVHRHRMAPRIAADLRALHTDGGLRVRRGTLLAVAAHQAGGLTVRLAQGGSQRYAAVVDATGPGRWPSAGDPFVDGLVAAGLARPGPHGLGLDVDRDGALLAPVQAALWTIGPPRRGRFWETTAVPEIRGQARALALTFAAADAAGSAAEAAAGRVA
jgi:uncharacterized NAD(P)/FAD-binding protein YdhS